MQEHQGGSGMPQVVEADPGQTSPAQDAFELVVQDLLLLGGAQFGKDQHG